MQTFVDMVQGSLRRGTWFSVVPATERLSTLVFSKSSLVQLDAPRILLCWAIIGWDSLENKDFVVLLSFFVISCISGDLLFSIHYY
jgi:hypothetical protein